MGIPYLSAQGRREIVKWRDWGEGGYNINGNHTAKTEIEWFQGPIVLESVMLSANITPQENICEESGRLLLLNITSCLKESDMFCLRKYGEG